MPEATSAENISIAPEAPIAFDHIEDVSCAEIASHPSRISRIGSFVIGLPTNVYDGVKKSTEAIQASSPYLYSKRILQAGVVGAELLPINEAVRYGTLALVLENTSGGAMAGALALGLTTFVIEGSAAVATAGLLETKTSDKLLNKVNTYIERRTNGHKFRMNHFAEAGIAMYGGSAMVLVEKQREDSSRTLRQNRRSGLITAGLLSMYFAGEGAFIGANSTNGDALNARTVGAALLAIGITFSGARLALRHISKPIGNGTND